MVVEPVEPVEHQVEAAAVELEPVEPVEPAVEDRRRTRDCYVHIILERSL